MTDLSPAAQAVLDTYMNNCGWLDGPLDRDYRCVAAVLRAAAQTEYKPDMRDEMEVMFSEGWNSHRKELLSIADELEGADG